MELGTSNSSNNTNLARQQARRIARHLLSVLQSKVHTTHVIGARSRSELDALADSLTEALLNSTEPELEVAIAYLSENCDGFQSAWERLCQEGDIGRILRAVILSARELPSL